MRDLTPDEVLIDVLHMPIEEQKRYCKSLLLRPELDGKRVVIQHDDSIDLLAIYQRDQED